MTARHNGGMKTEDGHTTNYRTTFIEVAEDCPVVSAEVPAARARPTVAQRQFELIDEAPYQLTSDDLLFRIHAERTGIPPEEWPEARAAFFSKGQPCLRASPLAKRYGWGIHHDDDGRVALVPLGSERYAELAADPAVQHVRAMRSSRG